MLVADLLRCHLSSVHLPILALVLWGVPRSRETSSVTPLFTHPFRAVYSLTRSDVKSPSAAKPGFVCYSRIGGAYEVAPLTAR